MKILVGVDQSDTSASALHWAMNLATDMEAGRVEDAHGDRVELLVLEAWHYPVVPGLAGPDVRVDPDKMDLRVRHDLRSFVQRCRSEGRAAPFDEIELLIGRGPAATAIQTVAAERHVDLVVVGSRGLGALDRYVLGSTSRELTRSAPCDVAVVPIGAEHLEGPIVVGADDSDDARAALDLAVGITGSLHDGEVVLVHCANAAELAPARVGLPLGVYEFSSNAAVHLTEELASVVAAQGLPSRSIISAGDPRLALEEVAGLERSRLVIVGAHGHGGLERWLFGSVSERLVTHPASAVAVARAR